MASHGDASKNLNKLGQRLTLLAVVNRKRSNQISIRLTDLEADAFYGLSEQSGVSVSELLRRLMQAARECFDENDGWPREIVVVKKPRDGQDIQPVATLAAPGTQNVKGQTRSLSATHANAEPELTTKRTPRPYRTSKK